MLACLLAWRGRGSREVIICRNTCSLVLDAPTPAQGAHPIRKVKGAAARRPEPKAVKAALLRELKQVEGRRPSLVSAKSGHAAAMHSKLNADVGGWEGDAVVCLRSPPHKTVLTHAPPLTSPCPIHAQIKRKAVVAELQRKSMARR